MRGQRTATMFGQMMWWCHVYAMFGLAEGALVDEKPAAVLQDAGCFFGVFYHRTFPVTQLRLPVCEPFSLVQRLALCAWAQDSTWPAVQPLSRPNAAIAKHYDWTAQASHSSLHQEKVRREDRATVCSCCCRIKKSGVRLGVCASFNVGRTRQYKYLYKHTMEHWMGALSWRRGCAGPHRSPRSAWRTEKNSRRCQVWDQDE